MREVTEVDGTELAEVEIAERRAEVVKVEIAEGPLLLMARGTAEKAWARGRFWRPAASSTRRMLVAFIIVSSFRHELRFVGNSKRTGNRYSEWF